MSRPLSPMLPILVVDDEAHALESTETVLMSAGLNNVRLRQDSREVMPLLSEMDVGVILLDLSMPHLSGQDLLPELAETYPEVPVIIVTGMNDIESAVECMRMGAFDYMVKPVEETRLISGVQRAIDLRESRTEIKLLRDQVFSPAMLDHPEAFADIVTRNAGIQRIFRYIEMIAATPKPVLITGETGVGKELFARSVHRLSGRRGAFVAVNAAGVDENVFADTLFGHTRGAFTGADEARPGLIEQAAGGTLFLDEIGDLSPISQVKLLRLVQSGEYLAVGADIPKWSDTRLILATNRNLDALQRSGQFRTDLYHRLQTHRIEAPPLRNRLDDLPCLVEHFLGRASQALGKKKPVYPKELIMLLASYHFPGNVRELESMICDAVANHHSRILSMKMFKARIDQTREASRVKTRPESADLKDGLFTYLEDLPTLREVSELLIAEAIRRSKGNQSIAARLLGTTRSAVNKRLHRNDAPDQV